MAYKQKGSPFQRNFGVGKSPAKQNESPLQVGEFLPEPGKGRVRNKWIKGIKDRIFEGKRDRVSRKEMKAYDDKILDLYKLKDDAEDWALSPEDIVKWGGEISPELLDHYQNPTYGYRLDPHLKEENEKVRQKAIENISGKIRDKWLRKETTGLDHIRNLQRRHKWEKKYGNLEEGGVDDIFMNWVKRDPKRLEKYLEAKEFMKTAEGKKDRKIQDRLNKMDAQEQ
jgi:hypothetical protein